MSKKDKVGGGYTFNTGLRQVEFISERSNDTVKAYYRWRDKPDEKHYRQLRNMLETFALTVAARAEPSDLSGYNHIIPSGKDNPSPIDVLESIDNLPEENEDAEKNDVRNIYIEVIQLMKDLKLDIPKEAQRDPDNVV